MAVYHFTVHAYRNWRPDHPRGYTRRGRGYQRCDPEQADAYDDRAKQPPATFAPDVQVMLVRAAHEFCRRRRMRLHAVGNEEGHVHYVLSWRGYADWHEVMRRLKNVLATVLNAHFGTPGKRWFVRGGSRKRVADRAHLDHLKTRYLPDHPGLFWCEEMPLP